MATTSTLRVAAVQYAVGADIDENLTTTLRMLDAAAAHSPHIIVLPEFCNHLSWYQDKQHCYDVSVALDGSFLNAIAAKAKALSCYVVANCTVQRAGGVATGSSLMYSPSGELVADNTKQIYIGHENDFLEKAQQPGPIIGLPWGRVGFYACMDGVINETPRCLALRGAQLLCNSLNSFASDEGSLHIPVRAAENKVFVVAANKVGPLVPEAMLAGISAATGIPERFLCGSGESQIVAPDGTVLARASLDREEVVFADIDLADAEQKTRPDGTDVFASRRTNLYRAIAQDPAGQSRPAPMGHAKVSALIAPLKNQGQGALEEVAQLVADLRGQGVRWLALSPLQSAATMAADVAAAFEFTQRAISRLSALCGVDKLVISTTGVIKNISGEYQHSALLIGAQGVLLAQGQLHTSQRFAWSALANEVQSVALNFGRVGLLTSDDSIYPEAFRLLAMAGVEAASVALEPLEAWELQTGLLERSAENRIGLLVAAMPSTLGESFATVLQSDFTVLTPWASRPFDGLLSQPEWHRLAAGQSTLAVSLNLAVAANKEVSRNTDLLDNRPWELAGAIVM